MKHPLGSSDLASDSPESSSPGSSIVAHLEMEDLEERLRAVRKKKSRHALWALLGLSPAALLPAVGLLLEGSDTLLVFLAILVTVSQGYAWAKSSLEAKKLESKLQALCEGRLPAPSE